MNSPISESSPFIGPDPYHSLRWYRLGLALSFVLGIVGVIQTQWFVGLLPGPSIESIRNHIKDSQERQAQVAKDFHNSPLGHQELPKGIDIYRELFNERQLALLRDAREFAMQDVTLQKLLEQKYGASLTNLNVVVVPGWVIDLPDNNEMIGITDAGYEGCAAGKGECDVGGFTIRDKPRETQKTVDGRPRMFLNATAFQSTSALRLTFFHEMLHAMSIPGHDPCFCIFAQSDLTYLPEYRTVITNANLNRSRERFIWSLGVAAPLIVCILILYQHEKRRRIPPSGSGDLETAVTMDALSIIPPEQSNRQNKESDC